MLYQLLGGNSIPVLVITGPVICVAIQKSIYGGIALLLSSLRYRGRVMNRASRIAGVTKTGQVWCSEDAWWVGGSWWLFCPWCTLATLAARPLMCCATPPPFCDAPPGFTLSRTSTPMRPGMGSWRRQPLGLPCVRLVPEVWAAPVPRAAQRSGRHSQLLQHTGRGALCLLCQGL
jgi:hypothetical protein